MINILPQLCVDIALHPGKCQGHYVLLLTLVWRKSLEERFRCSFTHHAFLDIKLMLLYFFFGWTFLVWIWLRVLD